MVGLMNDTTDLWEAIQETGTWIVHLLGGNDQVLADRFAGLRPSPGGLFVGLEVKDTEFGPLLASHPNHAYCRLLDSSVSGFQQLIRGSIERAEVADLDEALTYFRGNYRRVT